MAAPDEPPRDLSAVIAAEMRSRYVMIRKVGEIERKGVTEAEVNNGLCGLK